MALFGVDFYGASRYGPRIFLDYNAEPLLAAAVGGYNSLFVSWTTPVGQWSQLRLVRNAFGSPVDQNDGEILIDSMSGPAVPAGSRAAAVRTYADNDLEGGRFQYYAIWLYVPASDEWTRAASTIGLPLKDYGYSNRLWELTPSILRTKTTGLLDADNLELKTFEQVFGYQLDGHRAELDTLRDVNDPEKVSGNLLPLMAQQWGQFFEPELGMKQMRNLLRDTVHLYRNKGTIPGVEGFVSAISGYGATVQPLKNLLLDYNDSSAEESIGRWFADINGSVVRYVADGTVNSAPDSIGSLMRNKGIFKLTATAAGNARMRGPMSTYEGPGSQRYGVPVTAGQQYTFSGYARAGAGTPNAQVGVFWLDINGNYLSEGMSVGFPTTTNWTQRPTFTAVAPVGACWAVPSAQFAAAGAGSIMYWDAFQFETGGTATTYEDARLIDVNVLAPRVNQIANPSFETDLSSWTGAAYRNMLTANQSSIETDATGWAGTGTITRTTSQSRSGAAALSWAWPASGVATIVTAPNAASGPGVLPGQVYTAVASVKAATVGREYQLIIYWYDATGAYITNTGRPISDNTAGWTSWALTAQAPANAHFAAVNIYSPVTYSGEVHYVDTVGLFADPAGNLRPDPDFSVPSNVQQAGSGPGAIWSQNLHAIGGGTRTWTTEDAYTGRSSMKVIAASGEGTETNVNAGVPLLVGTTYTASVYVKHASGSVTLGVANAGSASYQGVSSSSSNTGWQRLSVTFTPTQTNGVVLYLSAVTPTTFYVDAVQLVVGSVAQPWLSPSTVNLAPSNPSAETSGATWSQYGDTATVIGSFSTEQAKVGSTSWKVAWTSADPAFRGGMNISVGYMAPGSRIIGSVYVRPNRAMTVSPWFDYTNTSGAPTFAQGAGPQQVCPANEWTRVTTASWVVPADVASVTLTAYDASTGASVAGDVAYYDCLQVEYGSVATPFVSGALGAGYSWESSDNLIANPSFEANTSGWSGLNKNLLPANESSFETSVAGWNGSGTLARSTAQSRAGTASLQLTATGTDTYAYTNSRYPVVGGQVYTITAVVRAGSTPRGAYIRYEFYDANNVLISLPAGPVIADNSAGWSQITATVQAPATAVSTLVLVGFPGTAVGEVHYIDAVGLFETPRGNLVSNPSFENHVQGWQSRLNATITQTTAQSYTGRAAGAITAIASGDTSAYFDFAKPCIGGMAYTFTARVRAATTPRPSNLTVDWYASGSYISSSYSTAVADTTSGWTTLTFTATAPANATFMGSYVYFTGTPAGEVHYVDAVQLVVGSTAPTWVPPSSSNLVTNPVTDGTYGMGSDNAMTLGTTAGYVGTARTLTYSAVTGSGLGTNFYMNMGTADRIPVVPGQTYTFSAWVRPPRNVTNGDVYLYFDNDSSPVTFTTLGISLTANVWTRITLTRTAPAGAASCWLLGARLHGLQVGDVVAVNGFQLELGSAATPYVDGTVGPGYSWETADNLITNPSFETDTSSWSGLNKNLLSANQSSAETDTSGFSTVDFTLTRSTTYAAVGTASLKAVCTVTNSQYPVYTDAGGGAVPIIPGQVYTAVGKVRGTSKTMRLHLYWRNSSGDVGNVWQDVSANPVGWVQATVSGQAPPTATHAYLLWRSPVSAIGDTWYFDEFGFFETPLANLLTPELATNEGGSTRWTVYTGASNAAVSTANAYTGRQSTTWLTSVGAGSDSVVYSEYPPGDIIAGNTYTASLWVWCGVATTAKLRLQWDQRDVASTGSVDGSVTTVPANTWTRITVAGVAVAGTTAARLLPVVASPGAGTPIYVDAAQLVVGNSLPAWVPPTTTNLVTNPSFEADTSGWFGVNLGAGDAFARSTVRSYVGAASGQLTTDSAATDTYAEIGVPVTVGTYAVSAYVYLTGAGATFLDRDSLMYVQSGSGTWPLNVAYNRSLVNQWQRISAVVTMTTPGIIGVRFYAPAGADVFFDAVQVEAGSTPTPYVDGNLGTGYIWEAAEALVSYDAEDGTTAGWGANIGSLSNSTAQFVDGTRSLLWTNDSGGVAQGEMYYGATAYAPAGTTLTYSAWVRPSTAQMLAIQVYYGAFPTGDGPLTACPANTWTRLVATVVVPPGADHGTLTIYSQANVANGVTIYTDAIQVEQKDHATAYLVGATANAATSRRQTPWALGGTSLETLSRSNNVTAASGSYYLDPGIPAALDLGVPNMSGAETLVAVAPLTTYTLSYSLQGGAVSRVLDGATLLATGNASGLVGSSRAMVTFTTGVSTTQIRVQFVWNGSYPLRPGIVSAGGAFYLDAVQLEQKDHATPFGSTGAVNVSTSVRRTPWVLGGASVEAVQQSTFAPYPGQTYSLTSSNGNTLAPLWPYSPLGYETVVPVAPNTTYTASAWRKYGGGGTHRVVDGVTGAVLASGTADANTGLWTRFALTFATGPTTTSVRYQHVMGTVNDFLLDLVQVEQKDYPTPYGSTGAANASPSRRQTPWTLGGQGVTTLTRTNEVASPSVLGAGSWVLRVDNIEGLGSGAATDVTLEPFTTYTMSAYCRVPAGEVAPLLQATESRLGGTLLGTGQAETVSDSWSRLSLTFTTGAATAITVGVVASARTKTSDNFYVDSVLLEKGSIVDTYFDGSTYAFIGDSLWEGAGNNSRSHYYPQRRAKNFRMAALLPTYTPAGSSSRLNYAQPLA